MRYRFDVVCANVADVVSFAGGWVFDRVMAGWDVTVLVDGQRDLRPIHILGADILDLETALATWQERPRPHALAVSMELIEADPRIRQRVQDALDHGTTEVTMWGDRWPADLDRGVDSVEHRLSAAARAFKAQALAALDLPALAVGAAESFSSGVTNCLSVATDLVPAG
ncbi:MAG: hypothetical protein QOH57_2399 [Mycobacterium sp.]|jgi:hypothetical protein|nr:hypothetical protein [Mycobacterium sp.]